MREDIKIDQKLHWFFKSKTNSLGRIIIIRKNVWRMATEHTSVYVNKKAAPSCLPAMSLLRNVLKVQIDGPNHTYMCMISMAQIHTKLTEKNYMVSILQ